MRQFVNSIDILLAESLDGFATAHADNCPPHAPPNIFLALPNRSCA
jgi:hypothetical protein